MIIFANPQPATEVYRALQARSVPDGCSFLAYSWKLPACSGAFLLTVMFGSFLLTVGAFYFQLELFGLQLELFCLQ